MLKSQYEKSQKNIQKMNTLMPVINTNIHKIPRSSTIKMVDPTGPAGSAVSVS